MPYRYGADPAQLWSIYCLQIEGLGLDELLKWTELRAGNPLLRGIDCQPVFDLLERSFCTIRQGFQRDSMLKKVGVLKSPS